MPAAAYLIVHTLEWSMTNEKICDFHLFNLAVPRLECYDQHVSILTGLPGRSGNQMQELLHEIRVRIASKTITIISHEEHSIAALADRSELVPRV